MSRLGNNQNRDYASMTEDQLYDFIWRGDVHAVREHLYRVYEGTAEPLHRDIKGSKRVIDGEV